MAVDYCIFLEERMNLKTIAANLALHIHFTCETAADNKLYLKEVSGLFHLWANQELDPRRDYTHVCDHRVNTLLMVKFDRERSSDAKALFARVVKVVLQSSSEAVTVAVNWEAVVLRRKARESVPTICMAKFWAESEERMLLESP